MTLDIYLPQDRLRALARGESLPDRTSGSALFADISGFTALTEGLRNSLGARRGAEELTKHLDAVYTSLIDQIEKYGGSVIDFAGDAIMCWFEARDESGGMRDESDTSGRAVACAFALQDAMRAFASIDLPNKQTASLTLKVAVTSGSARRFVVGEPSINYIDALAGATIARTSTAEHLARKGEVLIDESTVHALHGAFTIQEWREDDETHERFAVVEQGTEVRGQGTSLSVPRLPTPDPASVRPFILKAVCDREISQQGSFLTEFRPCVAMFVRFIGIDFDRAEAGAQLDQFIRQAQSIVTRHDGTFLQITIGDKGSYAYISFGIVSAHEDDAHRAIKVALELHSASTLQLQIGVTQGLMRVGAYGGPTRKSFGALGDDVNLAARLMSNAAPGEILVSGHVHKAVEQRFIFEPRPPLQLKGKAEPLPVFAVTGERQQRAIRLQEPTYALPMVGREKELAIINEQLAQALTGKSQVIGIVAEAGMGKSRLVAEVIRSARKQGFVGYGGACQADGINTPYLAWKPIWSAFFDIDPAAPLRKQIRNLAGEIEDRVPERAGALPLLSVVLNLDIPDNDFTKTLQPKFRKSILHALLQDCLRAEAIHESPLLIVIEDLHWIDALSRELLEELARALSDSPICFVMAYRPPELERSIDNVPALESMPNFTKIELHELTADEAGQAIRAKLAHLYPARSGGIPIGLVDSLMARAQGNPFFLEELLNYLHDRGLDPSDPADLDKIELPDSLQTLILSRIDQLSEREKTTLRVASIVGRLFRATWLTGYYPSLGESPQVKNDLDQLSALDITPLDSPEPELAYLFKHIVTHEVTYESLPFATRAKLHAQLARYLEAQIAAGALNELPLLETLAFHYERGEDWATAIQWLKRAGDLATAQWALAEAAELYRRALAALDHLSKQINLEFELRFNLAHIQMMLGVARDDVLAEYEHCLKLTSDRNQQAEVHFQMGQLLHIYTSSDLATAERYYNQALDLLDRERPNELYCSVFAFLGYLYRYQNRTDLSIETLERALELAEQFKSAERIAEVYIFLSGAYLDAGREDDALNASLQGLALAEKIGNLEMIGRAHSFCLDVYLSRAYAGRGSVEDALPHINEMRRHGREFGTAVLAGFGAEGLAVYHTLTGNRSAALECWRESAGIWLRSNSPNRAGYAHSKCGQVLLELGNRSAAIEAFELVKQDCGPNRANRAEFYIGLAYAGAGFDSDACAHLQSAFDATDSIDQRHIWLNMLRTDPEFTQLRSLPGVAALLSRVEARQ